MLNAKEAVARARKQGTVIPAFNVPYLPMLRPIVQAVVDENAVAMIQVARVEWEKFGAKSLEDIAAEYQKYSDEKHTLLHLDHVPVIDEDMKRVDFIPILKRAVVAGFQSVMIDGSRLELDANIAATNEAARIAHDAGIACEAELGAVMGHERGPAIPYEEIFASKKGFTQIGQVGRFVAESGCNWLSVAVGNIHGAIAEATRDQKKPEARLDVEHIKALYEAAGIPLVLHGGSGIKVDCIRQGIKAGIAKINVGTEIRQAYEKTMQATGNDIETARQATYEKVCGIINDMLNIKNTRTLLYGGE